MDRRGIEEVIVTDKPCVFIQCNHKQLLGGIVAEYALRRNSARADDFDVRIMHTKDFPFIEARDGQEYLRGGETAVWQYDNLQSFTPLRFAPPELAGYEGRAIVIDPDVFAIADVWELFERDMQGKAIVGRLRSGSKGRAGVMASSVLLLDCPQLKHWHCEEQFEELFTRKRDYMNWIGLELEPASSVGFFEDEWNDFDLLTPRTKMLHNTKRQTQPWKTGLPIDFNFARKRLRAAHPSSWFHPFVRLGRSILPPVYRRHPDPAQEDFFFGLLRECLENNVVDEKLLREEMRSNHLRHDALDLLERTSVAEARG